MECRRWALPHYSNPYASIHTVTTIKIQSRQTRQTKPNYPTRVLARCHCTAILLCPCFAWATLTVNLNMKWYFTKPVRSSWKNLHQQQEPFCGDQSTLLISNKNARLSHIMRLYEKIRVAYKQAKVSVNELVLFLEGDVSVPGDDVPESNPLRRMLINKCLSDGFGGLDQRYRPLNLFPRLLAKHGWCNIKPNSDQKTEYIAQLILWRAGINGEFTYWASPHWFWDCAA